MFEIKNLSAAAQAAAKATAAQLSSDKSLEANIEKLITAAKGLPTLLDGDELQLVDQVAKVLTFTDNNGESRDYFAFGADIIRKGKRFRSVNLGVSSFVRGSLLVATEMPEAGKVSGSELRPRFTGADVDFVDFDGVKLPAITGITLKIKGTKVFVPDFQENAFRKGSQAVWAWTEKENYGITL